MYGVPALLALDAQEVEGGQGSKGLDGFIRRLGRGTGEPLSYEAALELAMSQALLQVQKEEVGKVHLLCEKVFDGKKPVEESGAAQGRLGAAARLAKKACEDMAAKFKGASLTVTTGDSTVRSTRPGARTSRATCSFAGSSRRRCWAR